jgi:hypothetical protein
MSLIFGSVSNLVAGAKRFPGVLKNLPGNICLFATIMDAFHWQDTMVPMEIWVLVMCRAAFIYEDILHLTDFHIEDLPASFQKGWTKSPRSRCGDCN